MGADSSSVPVAGGGDMMIRQRGIALITAVLITALISIIAVTMVSEQQLDIRQTGNILDRTQAWQFALGMETIALQALLKDVEDNQVDHKMEDWGKPVQFPAPDGAEGDMIGGRIEDLQGRFNLNNLIDGNGNIVPGQIDQFKRLLRELKLPEGFAEKVADWIDVDSEPQGMEGAEDGEYSRLDPPYRTGNTPLVSPSELLLIMSAEEYKKLEKFVAALPPQGSGSTKINVNTASREVLLSLDSVTPEDIDELLQQREQLEKQDSRGFTDMNEILALPGFQNRPSGQNNFTQYIRDKCCSTKSDFFLASIFAQFDKGEVPLRSLIQRTKPQGQPKYKVYTVLRTQGDY